MVIVNAMVCQYYTAKNLDILNVALLIFPITIYVATFRKNCMENRTSFLINAMDVCQYELDF